MPARFPYLLLAAGLLAGSAPLFAQPAAGHGHPADHVAHGTPPPAYAGQQQHEIKALAADEQCALLTGAGLGYARAAELNHYPGPMHVVELAEALALTAEQRRASERLLHEHKAEARALGARVVDAEREVDRLFAAGPLDVTTLAAAVSQAGAALSAYRLAHLEAHRRQRELLTPAQVAEYDRRRGYVAAGS